MNTDFSVLRTRMVDGQLRTTDVTDLSILDAMATVPREEFVPAKRRELAYLDEDIEIASGAAPRFLMETSPFAKLLQLAQIRNEDVVLDIGSGTGYSAAVLSHLSASVIALEENADLAALAQSNLARLGYHHVAVVQAPLAGGYPSEGPYDVMLIEGAVGAVPEALFGQLKEGGRLVVVEGTGNAGVAKVYLRHDGIVSGRRVFNAAVKPLPGFERLRGFEF